MAHEWKRPDLPEDHKGGGLMTGWLAIAAGVIFSFVSGAILGGEEPDPSWIIWFYLGAACLGLGFLIIPVCLILREIRRMAFEAALRAGEVKDAKAKIDKYEAYLAREAAEAIDSDVDGLKV